MDNNETGLAAALRYTAGQQQLIDFHKQTEIDGRPYYFDNEGDLTPIYNPAPRILEVTTLTGLLDYIASNPDSLDMSKMTIHVEGYNSVALVGPIGGPFLERTSYIVAKAIKETRQCSPIDRNIDAEDFILWVSANVVPDDERDALLKAVAAIQVDAGAVLTDDGVSQTVTTAAGARLVDRATLKSRVMIRPYSTFMEITQPAREFVLRLDKSGRPGLFSADGDKWKLDAIQAIREWFTGHDGNPCHILA